MTDNKTVGIIPARYNSQRLPGKMLRDILGKSLIRRTYENACRCAILSEVMVATDDQRIYDHVLEFGGKVVMSSPECSSGTDRVAEVVRDHCPDAEMVINIQGDEPCLDPEVVEKLARKLMSSVEVVLATPVTKIDREKDLFDPSVVKCVFDRSGRALYFSRSPIPFTRIFDDQTSYYRHLGIYGFKREFLLQVPSLPLSPLQKSEDLEQLKILEHGYPVHVCIVKDQSIGVDTIEDLKRVEELCQKNTSLSQAVSSPR